MIDFNKFSYAVQYYTSCGYHLLEVPWTVDPEATLSTLPKHVDRNRLTELKTPWGDLVGSAEQGFVQLMLDGKMPKGMHMAVTPCFRIEEKYDEISRPYFMKLELIVYPCNDITVVNQMLDKAGNFFSYFIPIHYTSFLDVERSMLVEKLTSGESVETDILTQRDDVELGSYGLRKHGKHIWAYGTGLAEPRLSSQIE